MAFVDDGGGREASSFSRAERIRTSPDRLDRRQYFSTFLPSSRKRGCATQRYEMYNSGSLIHIKIIHTLIRAWWMRESLRPRKRRGKRTKNVNPVVRIAAIALPTTKNKKLFADVFGEKNALTLDRIERPLYLDIYLI